MKATTRITRCRVFRSEVRPDIESGYLGDEAVLGWADGHPVVWDIVTTRRSKAFGLESCEYIGWAQRSTEPNAVLERVRHIHDLVVSPHRHLDPNSIFPWRAKFTLERFRDKGFTSGFFQQWDSAFARGCLALDYSPGTLEEVIDRFAAWMDRHYRTARITLDGETVRTFGEG